MPAPKRKKKAAAKKRGKGRTAKRGGCAVGRTELARILRVTPNRISQLVAEGLPAISAGRKGARSSFDVREAVPWYLAYRDPGESPRDQRDREQAALLRLKREREEGQLWQRDNIVRAIRTIIETAKARLRRLDYDLSREGHIPPEGRPAVQRAVGEALRELGRLDGVASE